MSRTSRAEVFGQRLRMRLANGCETKKPQKGPSQYFHGTRIVLRLLGIVRRYCPDGQSGRSLKIGWHVIEFDLLDSF